MHAKINLRLVSACPFEGGCPLLGGSTVIAMKLQMETNILQDLSLCLLEINA